jgi:hypothetical protein
VAPHAATGHARGSLGHGDAGVGVPTVGGQVALPARDLLKFSAAAEDPSAALPAGWSTLTAAQLRALGIDPASLHDATSGLDASVFTDGHGHYVIGYAGSKQTVDWVEDGFGIASGGLPALSPQTVGAVALARTLVGHVGADNVEITGHSLGGRDASIASVATGTRAVTFNAAGVTDDDLTYVQLTSPGGGAGDLALETNPVMRVIDNMTDGSLIRASVDQSKITNYVIVNDFVTDGTILANARTALGGIVVLPTDTPNPLAAHDLSNFDGKVG